MDKYVKPEVDIVEIKNEGIFTESNDGAFEVEEDKFN